MSTSGQVPALAGAATALQADGEAAGLPRGLAAFDFDGTLTLRDTLLPFLLHLCGRRSVAAAFVRHAPSLVSSAAGLGDRDAAKAAVLARLLAGRPLAELADAAERTAPTVRLRDRMVERVAWHHRLGHEVVVVTASPTVVVTPVARRFGVDTVLGTGLETDADGRLTGRLDGRNNRGPEKLVRLRDHLDGATVELWAYGDSAGDRELLGAADHPVWVR